MWDIILSSQCIGKVSFGLKFAFIVIWNRVTNNVPLQAIYWIWKKVCNQTFLWVFFRQFRNSTKFRIEKKIGLRVRQDLLFRNKRTLFIWIQMLKYRRQKNVGQVLDDDPISQSEFRWQSVYGIKYITYITASIEYDFYALEMRAFAFGQI